MKKLLVFLLALVLCVGLLGCANEGNENTPSNNTEHSNTKVTETTIVTESTEATIVTEPTQVTETTKATEATEITNATESTREHPDDEQVTMVWIPTKGGTKYHSKANCSGMEEPNQVTQSQAEQQGFTPCKKCYKS